MFGLGLYIYAGEDLPDIEIICKKCGELITPTKGKNGKILSPMDIAKNTNGLCSKCYKCSISSQVIRETSIAGRA